MAGALHKAPGIRMTTSVDEIKSRLAAVLVTAVRPAETAGGNGT
jgi:hypothetical protein